MSPTNPPPVRAGAAIRVVMGIVAVLAAVATFVSAGIALLALLFTGLVWPTGDQYDAAYIAIQLATIAVPVLCLLTTVIAVIAMVTGRLWAVITSGSLFLAMIVTTALLNLWIGASN